MLNVCSNQFHFPTPSFLVRSFSEVTQDIQLKRIFCTTLFDVNIITARHNARTASAVLATAIPSVSPSVRLSVRQSVCPSVRHTPVLCQNDGTWHGEVCTVG